MDEFIIGSIIEKSITFDYGKTFFYVMNDRRKVLIVLEDNVSLPECLEGTFEFRGTMSFSSKNKFLKLRTTSIKHIPDLRDSRDELRQLVASMR